MAQETIPVQGLASSAAPLTYSVAVGDSFDLMAAFASFDGSGAAAAWVPALQVLAPSGAVMVSTIGSSVAAGGSADVTFAPFLEGATNTTPSGGGGLAWANIILGGATLADSGFNMNFINFDTTTFVTTDSSVFSVATGFLNHGIQALVPGIYFAWVAVRGQSNAVPAAGSMIRADLQTTFGEEFNFSVPSGWFQIDAAPLYEAGATFGWQAVINTTSSPAPQTFKAKVGQNSGGNVLFDARLHVVQIDTRTLS